MGAAHGEKVVRAYRRAVERTPADGRAAARRAARACRRAWSSLIQMARTARRGARARRRPGSCRWPSTAARRPAACSRPYASLVDVSAARPGRRHRLHRASRRRAHHRRAAAGGLAHRRVRVRRTVWSTRSSTEDDEAAWIDVVLGIDGAAAAAVRVRASPTGEPTATEPWGEVQRARARRRFTGRQWADLLCAPWVELRGTDPTLQRRAGDHRRATRRRDRRRSPGRRRQAPARGLPPGPPRHRPRRPPRAAAAHVRGHAPAPTRGPTPRPTASPARSPSRSRPWTALPTPSVSVCVGEGGSGGALALAYADRLLIQEHAIFSVIAPEGAAAILERDAAKAPELAARLRLTSADLLDLGIVDAVVARGFRVALPRARRRPRRGPSR